jgi:PIN domain nuclease of toxin-antitoxin system
MEWAHRDPFDRLIVATALALGVALISKDRAFTDREDLTLVW